MRAWPKTRLLTIPLLWLPAILALWIYISTRDWPHLRRQYEMGHTPTWPPRAEHGPKSEAVAVVQHALVTVIPVAVIAVIATLSLALVGLASRAWHRHRRMRAIAPGEPGA